MPATLAVCKSRELSPAEGELAEAGSAFTTPVTTAPGLLEATEEFVSVLPAELRNIRGPSIPTENPISTSSAALHAGCGEIQLEGSSAPIVRRSQLRSSCWSKLSSKPARQLASSDASGSVCRAASSASISCSCVKARLHPEQYCR